MIKRLLEIREIVLSETSTVEEKLDAIEEFLKMEPAKVIRIEKESSK